MFNDVIPSHLAQTENFYDGNMFGNTRLRPGEVIERIPPKDPRNVNKKFHEYTCFVQHRENGTAVTKLYKHCVLIDAFAGLADHLSYTLRADPVATQAKNKAPGPGKGSKVLLLCVNGETHHAIIIGGLRDAAGEGDDEAKGHNLHFAFNGVDIVIDKDGQLLLNVNGATEIDGKPKKETATDKLPTTVKIEKDGKFTVQTKDGKNSIVIDQKGTITVTAEKEAKVQSAKNTFTIKSDGSIEFNAEKIFNIVSKGPVNVKAAAKCTVIAKQVELGSSGVGGKPPQGVVLGSWVEPLTGAPVFALGGTSNKVFAAK